MTMPQHSQQELLDILDRICNSLTPIISTARNAIKDRIISKSELELLMRNLKSQEMDVLTHLLGLKGETTKTINQTAAQIPGITPGMVPDLTHRGLHILTLCLESADPTFNPYATSPVPSNPTRNQLSAQISLMGHERGDPNMGNVSEACYHRKFDIDIICSKTREYWLRTWGEGVLDLLERVLAVFGRKLTSASMVFLRQRLENIPGGLCALSLISDTLIQGPSLEKLQETIKDPRWAEINSLGAMIGFMLSSPPNNDRLQELEDLVLNQSRYLLGILIGACEIEIATALNKI